MSHQIIFTKIFLWLTEIASSKNKAYLFTYIVGLVLSKCGECCWMNKRERRAVKSPTLKAGAFFLFGCFIGFTAFLFMILFKLSRKVWFYRYLLVIPDIRKMSCAPHSSQFPKEKVSKKNCWAKQARSCSRLLKEGREIELSASETKERKILSTRGRKWKNTKDISRESPVNVISHLCLLIGSY